MPEYFQTKTGFSFPIPKTLTGRFIPVDKINFKAFSENNEKIFYLHGRELSFLTVVLVDKNKKKFYTNYKKKKNRGYLLYDSIEKSSTMYGRPRYDVDQVEITRFKIRMSLDFIHDNVNRKEVFLVDNGYANDLEVATYNKINNKDKIRTLYRQNNYIDENAANSNVETKRNSNILTLMNNIEACLSIIKDISPHTFLVGFKLLDGVCKEKLISVGKDLMKKNNCDIVVANDLSNIRNGCHKAYLLDKNDDISTAIGKENIAKKLVKKIQRGNY